MVASSRRSRNDRANAATIVLGISLLCVPARAAETLRHHLEYSTSVAHAYHARSLFTNPAALGFQTELDGAALDASVTAGLHRDADDELSVALSYGYLGLGGMRLVTPSGTLSRYLVGLGFPVSSQLFFGTRYSFSRSESAALDDFHSIDLGLQWRPARFLAVGALVETLNQPTMGGTRVPARIGGGVALRPLSFLELTGDVDTLADRFGERWGWEVNAAVEPLRGVFLRGGYHKDRRWQAGLQINFALGSYYTVHQPDRPERSFLVGAQLSTRPYPAVVSIRTAVELDIDHTLGEQPVRGGLFASDRPSLWDMIDRVERARRQPEVTHILVRLKQFPLGLAAAQDLFQALWRAREAGKQIEAFLGNAGLREYLVASAAQKIHVEPGGELRLLGLAESRYYLKGTLDKLGVEGELLAKGKYKSAPEMFTRKEASPAHREAAFDRLRAAEAAVLDILGRAKRVSPEKWKAVLRQAAFGAEDAVATGLADAVRTYSARRDEIGRNTWIREVPTQNRNLLSLPPRVAVVVASGDILQRESGLLSMVAGTPVTPERMKDQLDQAVRDQRAKAIVLRVSSPGGEILPSQQIASLVGAVGEKKPLVASMGDVAASGGYLISAPASKIVAQPLTATGSIGVFLGKFNLQGLYEKIDLRKEILSEAPLAGLYSEDRPLSKEGREVLERRLDEYYASFVRFVSTQRRLSPEDVEKAAQGRVWLGGQAQSRKLVDHVGGYLDAVEAAAKAAGLEPGEFEVSVVERRAPLFSLFGDGWLRSSVANEVPFLSEGLARELRWAAAAQQYPLLYLTPFDKLE